MVKRHALLAHPTFPDLPAEVVSAQDYDALAASLAEAQVAFVARGMDLRDVEARLAEAEAALANALIDPWWAQAYFNKYPRTPETVDGSEP